MDVLILLVGVEVGELYHVMVKLCHDLGEITIKVSSQLKILLLSVVISQDQEFVLASEDLSNLVIQNCNRLQICTRHLTFLHI
jgi:ABC-type enterochelin transport system ATPase subunit